MKPLLKLHAIKALTLVFGFVFLPLILLAQPQNIAVFGVVDDYKSGLQGVHITIKVDGKVIANHISGPKGVFEFKLNYGNDYIIAFSKDGYVTKLINVLAKNVTQDMVSIGQKDQDWTVGLFKYMEGIDYSDLDHPVGKVYFEPSSKTFDWDAGYSLGILQKMQDLQAKQEKAEAEKAKKEKETEAAFSSAIKSAEKALSKGDLATAQSELNKAKTLRPNDLQTATIEQKVTTLVQAQKNKEEEAKKLALQQQVEAEEIKKLEEEKVKKQQDYDKLVTDANQLLTAQKFDDAIKKLELAKNILPENKETDKLIAKAKDLQLAKTKETQKIAEAEALKAEEEKKAQEKATIEAQKQAQKQEQEKIAQLEKEKQEQEKIALKKAQEEEIKKAELLAAQSKQTETKELKPANEPKQPEKLDVKVPEPNSEPQKVELKKTESNTIPQKVENNPSNNQKELENFHKAEVVKTAKEVKKTSPKHHDDHDDMLAKLHQAEKIAQAKTVAADLNKHTTKYDENFDILSVNYHDPELYIYLRKNYPLGVSEEKFNLNNKIIVVRIVVYENHADVFRYVKHNWGGEYFFKNDISISKFIFDKETLLKN